MQCVNSELNAPCPHRDNDASSQNGKFLSVFLSKKSNFLAQQKVKKILMFLQFQKIILGITMQKYMRRGTSIKHIEPE